MNLAFEKILCAIDFSELSEGVIRAAEAMSERFGSTLLVFHSVCFPRERLSGVFDSPEVKGEKEAIHSAHEKIGTLMRGSKAPWKPVVLAGDPAGSIIHAARKEGADMVMAASYGLSGFKRLFLGTVVERFSSLLEAPVMILHEGIKPERKNVFRIGRIAVCCTLDPRSLALIDYGTALAKGWKAELILVHTLEAPPGEDGCGEELCSYEEAQERMRDRARSRLMNLIPQVRPKEVNPRPVVLLGVPGEQVRNFIRASDVDLVIVGGPRRGSVGSFIIGSTTQFLIRHAPCSVLSVASG